jgi:hypothetical protein
MPQDFPQPHRRFTPAGELRRVGAELELAGIDLRGLGAAVMHCFGGRLDTTERFVHHVRDTTLGDFTLELDATLLKEQGYQHLLEDLGLEADARARIDDVLERVTGTLVPHEVVSPPIPLDRLGELETLRAHLQRVKARGTRAALRYAFGLHLNPEAPGLEAEDITAHLKAFVLLRDRLREYGDIDLSRRLVPFIKDFPEHYARRVAAPEYWPDLDALVADYLADNPTRNRALDLLPLFAHLDPGRLPPALRANPLLKPRPTYHYRLPNCAIDEPDWTLAREWCGWLAVERLAADRAALERLGAEYLQTRQPPIAGFDPKWSAHTRPWLAE